MLFTGLRLSETAALQVADVRVSARKGLVVVRSGKGDAYREVELNALVRGMLDEWTAERAKLAAPDEASFFVARTGQALSSRSIDLAVRRVAARAGLELSAHVLRHTLGSSQDTPEKGSRRVNARLRRVSGDSAVLMRSDRRSQ